MQTFLPQGDMYLLSAQLDTWPVQYWALSFTDFGWGRPKRIEEISIDTTRAISLIESRDLEGGIEVGLALPKPEMDAFVTLYTEGLKALR